jgi:hypothetical protein
MTKNQTVKLEARLSARQGWRERFAKLRWFRKKNTVDELLEAFIQSELVRTVEAERRRIIDIAKQFKDYQCNDPKCDHNLVSFIKSLEKLNGTPTTKL